MSQSSDHLKVKITEFRCPHDLLWVPQSSVRLLEGGGGAADE